MSHPCQYNVYRRAKGEAKKHIHASFATLADAVNYAFDQSRGKYSHDPLTTMIVLNDDRKVFRKFIQGRAL